MKTLFVMIGLAVALSACNEDTWSLEYKDCDYLTKGEKIAAISDQKMTRDQAVAHLAQVKGITVEQADTCFGAYHSKTYN